jgi:hypothetical protein
MPSEVKYNHTVSKLVLGVVFMVFMACVWLARDAADAGQWGRVVSNVMIGLLAGAQLLLLWARE